MKRFNRYLVKRFNPRRLTFVLVSVAVGALVTACSGTSATGTNDKPAPLSTDPVTLTFSWWGNPTRAATTQKVLDSFHKKYPYITVEGQPVGDTTSYFTQLATETAAGDAPDVMTLGGAYPLAYAARGALLDMSTVKTELDTSPFPKSILTASTYKNKLYGLPTGANALAVIANPMVFQAAGVPMPDDNKWTWEDFVDAANKITKGSPQGTFGAEERVADLIGAYATQRDNALYDQDGKLSVTADTLTGMWTMEKSLLDGGGMPSASKTQEIIKAGPEQTLMGQGKSGMIFAYTNQLSAYQKAAGTELKLLRLPGETEYKRPGMTLLPSQYYSIYSKSKHPRQAALLLDYLVNSTEAGQLILTDRGLPSNPTVRAAIQSSLEPADQASAAFVDRISKIDSPATPPAPASSSGQNDITYNIDSQVLFGKLTPSAGASAWLDQMKASMAGSVQ